MLRRRVAHDVGAEFQGLLKEWGSKNIVDDEERAGLVRQFGDGGEVDDLQGRVRRAFEEDRAGAGLQGLAPLVEVAAVDQRHLDPVMRQDVLQDVEARPEEGARGDDAVARAHEARERGEHRGHPARRTPAHLGAFEEPKAFLEHRHRRVGIARIDIARAFIGEGRFRLLGGGVHKAAGHVDRFAGLQELAAQDTALRHDRARAPGRIVGGLRHGHARSPPRATGTTKNPEPPWVRVPEEPPTF